jgi:parallel beta-helix repeat protein
LNFVNTFAALLLYACLLVHPHDARAETFDTCAGFIDTAPTTISTQGVWCLRHDLATNVTSGAAITIAANNVTIDCNDFKIGGLAAGPATQTSGILAINRQNASVRHCNVRGFLVGIDITGGAGHLVEDNRLDNNLYAGIRADADTNTVRRNRVYDTGPAEEDLPAYGIYGGGEIVDNVIRNVVSKSATYRAIGIYVRGVNGSTVAGNQVVGVLNGVTPNVVGIASNVNNAYVADNHVDSGTTIDGYGIIGFGTGTVCARNVVVGWSNPGVNSISACQDAGGNAWH